MPSITFDAQSFVLDGKRVWLVGGTVEYTSLPRAAWADRLASAKAAGINCVTTSVVWARHEQRAGQFDFTGDNDLRHFLELVGSAGMYALLRLGPYVGGSRDLGGLPPWLLSNPNLQLRTASAPFLEATSRFIDAVARQVRDLQATAPEPNLRPAGGPIIAIQSESGWTCGQRTLAQSYLGEVHRYLRESGFEVPFVNANDLFEGVEGEIDGWTGAGAMLPHLRQLASVRPQQPKLVVEYRVGEQSVWSGKTAQPVTGHTLQRGLAEVLAAGAQFNIEPFAGGTHFGFSAGRLGDGPASFATTSADRQAPVGEDGTLRPHYHSLRRLALFASRFGRLFAHLDPRRHNVCLLPPEAAHQQAAGRAKKLAEITPGGHVIVDADGTQGSVAFIFAPADADGTPDSAGHDPATLLLPDGTILPVRLGDQPVAWVVLDTRLVGRSQLDYCNLSAIALAGRVFVCAGPAGTPARLSINGAELHAEVPTGDDPLLIEHEGVIVMIIADGMLPRVHIADDAVYLDVDGLSLDGQPIVPAWGTKFRKVQDKAVFEIVTAEQHPVRPAPKVETRKTPEPPKKKPAKGKKAPPAPPPPPPPPPLPPTAVIVPREKPPARITLSPWRTADLHGYLDGSGPRFASIAGPADLAALGAPGGYGWYRIGLKNSRAQKVLVAAPDSGDRLAFFEHARPAGVLGLGPGAESALTLRLARGQQTFVVLAENMGRFAESINMGEGKGLLGHLWAVEPIKIGKATMRHGLPLEPLAFRAPLWNVHQGDVTEPERLTWSIPRRGKGPMLLRLTPGRHRGLVLVGDKPVRAFDPSGPLSIMLPEASLTGRSIDVQLAILGDADTAQRDLAAALEAFDCVESLTAKAEWAFAKWERPAPADFELDPKRHLHVPRWWQSSFSLPGRKGDLWLDLAGMSKGQAYVNGRHLGRYFTATADGKRVGPQEALLVPGSWLSPSGANDVLLFDEHGFTPAKVRIRAER